MAAPRIYIDPDTGIPDLIHRLTDDSKRLVRDEIRLGKLEMVDDVKRAGRGSMWLAMALGVGVVAMVAGTILLVTLIGRLAGGHMWVGAVVTGVIEFAVAGLMIRHGLTAFEKPSYSLEQTRAGLEDIKG